MSTLDDSRASSIRNPSGLPAVHDEPGRSITQDLVGRIADLDAIAWNLPGCNREFLPSDLDPQLAAQGL
jgi:hypothetical protein